jgi:hypothetical protein
MSGGFGGGRPNLNVVALLYRWSLVRFTRRLAAGPHEVEAHMSAKRSRPRYVVLDLLGGNMLEIGGAAALGGLVLVLAARPVGAISHALSSALVLVGSLLATFPLSLVLAVLLWGAFPERRTDGFFRHPERLWLPSVLTMLFTAAAGVALWLRLG